MSLIQSCVNPTSTLVPDISRVDLRIELTFLLCQWSHERQQIIKAATIPHSGCRGDNYACNSRSVMYLTPSAFMHMVYGCVTDHRPWYHLYRHLDSTFYSI